MDVPRWRCLRLLAGVVLAFGAAVFPPATARGSCGDYVHFGGAMSDAGAVASLNPQPPRHPPGPADAPCTGPLCSRAPVLPPSVPGTEPPSLEDWASLEPPHPNSATGAHGRIFLRRQPRGCHAGPDVFRPPPALPLSRCA
jgi:hypothetical protein